MGKMNNAALAQMQIDNHGRDRYPSIQDQFIKLTEEVGELAKEVNRNNLNKARLEAADVALALYNLARKMGFDLDDAIADVVDKDTRNFRENTA
jgi:NTP pyrophosphatase (non-canonical NTP hydrolase)